MIIPCRSRAQTSNLLAIAQTTREELVLILV